MSTPHAAEQEQPSDEHVLPDADRLVIQIMKRNTSEPAYALLVVRGIIAKMPTEDAVNLIARVRPVDPGALIG